MSTSLVARASRVGIVAWAGVGLAIVLYLIGRYILLPIQVIFPPLLVALILVYLLNPIVSFLERRGLRRGWGTLLTYLVVLTGVGFALAYLIPIVSAQISAFVKSIPDLLKTASKDIAGLAHRLGFHSVRAGDLFSTFAPKGGASSFIGRIASITFGVLHVALVVVLGPVLAFYLLVDLPKLRQGIRAFVPSGRRAEAQSVVDKLATAVGGYFRGQLLVALFVGLASMLALYVIGLPYWAPVGLIAGLFNLVPLIGPFIGAIPAIFIAFTTPEPGAGLLLHPTPGWPLAVAAAIALTIVQQLDNHVISPNVVARTVKLHPLTVMLSLLAAGSVLGLWGMLLVIPVVASVKILLMHYWDTRLQWPPREPEVADPEAAEASVPTAVQVPPAGTSSVPGPRVAVSSNGGEGSPATADTKAGTTGNDGSWWTRARFWRRGPASPPARTRAAGED